MQRLARMQQEPATGTAGGAVKTSGDNCVAVVDVSPDNDSVATMTNLTFDEPTMYKEVRRNIG